MPAMKREEWLKLTPIQKQLHGVRRRLEEGKALYDRGRRSGEIAEPIAFFEPK